MKERKRYRRVQTLVQHLGRDRARPISKQSSRYSEDDGQLGARNATTESSPHPRLTTVGVKSA